MAMINRALRLIRVYHDLNQSDVAARVGLSKSYVSEIEKDANVTLQVLEKYSNAFNIPVSSLMLFAEQAGESRLSEGARVLVADKALKMLDWIATISGEREKEKHV